MILRPLRSDRFLISKESDTIVSTRDVSKCSNQRKSEPLCALKIVCLYPALICNTDLRAFPQPRGVRWLNVCQRLQRGLCQEEKSLTEAASEKLWFVKGCLPHCKRCSFGNGNCLPNHLCNVSLMNVVNNVSARTTGNPPARGVSSRLPERLSTQFEVWSGRRSLTPTDLSLSALHWVAIRVELSLTAGFNTAIMPQTDRQMTYKQKYINTHMHTHCSHTAENHLHCTP